VSNIVPQQREGHVVWGKSENEYRHAVADASRGIKVIWLISGPVFPDRDGEAAKPPPLKSSLPANGVLGGTSSVELAAPLMAAKRIGVPGPVTTIMSGTKSPFTSATAVRMFPVNPGEQGRGAAEVLLVALGGAYA
jgi:hypothetical protein